MIKITEELFIEIYNKSNKRFTECNTLTLYELLRKNKHLILSSKDKERGVNNVLTFFNKTKSFENIKDEPVRIKLFLEDLSDVFFNAGSDDFKREEFEKCVLRFLCALHMQDDNLGITKSDLQGKTQDFNRTDYTKMRTNSKSKFNYPYSLKLLLDEVFKCKFNAPKDITQEERKELIVKLNQIRKDLEESNP